MIRILERIRVRTLDGYSLYGKYLWHALVLVAFLAIGFGFLKNWEELILSPLQFDLRFITLALFVYSVTYLFHNLGWHNLACALIGDFPFAVNLEAAAHSNLVKYLPTVVWYIARRASFYNKRRVARSRVVLASATELFVMIGSGAFFLLTLLSLQYSVPVFVFGILLVVIVSLVVAWGTIHRESLRRFLSVRFGSTANPSSRSLVRLAIAIVMYAASWPVGALFFWFIVRATTTIRFEDMTTVMIIWLSAGLANYALTITVGALGFVRELTIVALLTQLTPVSVAVISAALSRLILTFGEIICSLFMLGILNLSKWNARQV